MCRHNLLHSLHKSHQHRPKICITYHQLGINWRALLRACISKGKVVAHSHISYPLSQTKLTLLASKGFRRNRFKGNSKPVPGLSTGSSKSPITMEPCLNVPMYTRELLVLDAGDLGIKGPHAGSTRRYPEAEVPFHPLLAPCVWSHPAFRPAASGRVFTLATLLCGRVISLSGVSVRKINYQSSSLAFSPTHHRTLKTNAKKIHFCRLGFGELGSVWILKHPCKLPSSGII